MICFSCEVTMRTTRYYPNFKCISIFPLQTEKQSTEVLQELNKNFIIHSELSA